MTLVAPVWVLCRMVLGVLLVCVFMGGYRGDMRIRVSMTVMPYTMAMIVIARSLWLCFIMYLWCVRAVLDLGGVSLDMPHHCAFV